MWAAGLTAGDEPAVMRPGGGGVRFVPEAGPAVVLGDATALGVFGSFAAVGCPVTGAVEIPAEDADAPEEAFGHPGMGGSSASPTRGRASPSATR